MNGFGIWLLLTENGRLDTAGFNALFRANLDELLPKITDRRRRDALHEMKNVDWIGYILASLRNAGFHDEGQHEEAAHDIAVYLLVQPGHLFAGYEPNASGPMPARLALSVANAIRNLRRSKTRRERRLPADGDDAASVPARGMVSTDDEWLDSFRHHLQKHLGHEAVELLDSRLSGRTYSQIAGQRTRWEVRRLVANIQDEARAFAANPRDDQFAAEIGRLLARRRT